MSQPHNPGEPVRDLTAAKWIEERLWPWGPGSGRSDLPVGSIVPEGFDAYARVLHPAYRQTEHGLEAVRWSTVASWTGRVVHPKMQFRGPIEAVPLLSFGNFSQAPNIWWPEDRAWCVASEIDLDETLVGGSSGSIAALLADPALETFPTSLDTAVDINSDEING